MPAFQELAEDHDRLVVAVHGIPHIERQRGTSVSSPPQRPTNDAALAVKGHLRPLRLQTPGGDLGLDLEGVMPTPGVVTMRAACCSSSAVGISILMPGILAFPRTERQ